MGYRLHLLIAFAHPDCCQQTCSEMSVEKSVLLAISPFKLYYINEHSIWSALTLSLSATAHKKQTGL